MGNHSCTLYHPVKRKHTSDIEQKPNDTTIEPTHGLSLADKRVAILLSSLKGQLSNANYRMVTDSCPSAYVCMSLYPVKPSLQEICIHGCTLFTSDDTKQCIKCSFPSTQDTDTWLSVGALYVLQEKTRDLLSLDNVFDPSNNDLRDIFDGDYFSHSHTGVVIFLLACLSMDLVLQTSPSRWSI
ncbi:unnamed protein product [Absidia cylindrospora]